MRTVGMKPDDKPKAARKTPAKKPAGRSAPAKKPAQTKEPQDGTGEGAEG